MKKIIIIGVVLIALGGAGFYFYTKRDVAPAYDTIVAARRDVRSEVSVTGRVVPASEVDLAFEKSGKIATVTASVGTRVAAGQTLVRLENADLAAQRLEAEASLKAEEALLADLKRGPRPEEIAVEEAKLAEARQSLTDKIRDAYTKADDAIRNKIDQFISNPRSTTPQINLTVSDSQLKAVAEEGRRAIELMLTSWSVSFGDTTASAESVAGNAKKNLFAVKDFVNNIALLVNTADTSAAITKTMLEAYRADVATARTTIDTALNNVFAAESALAVQEQRLALAKLGSTDEAVAVQAAKVERARASIENIGAQLAKTVLAAPISGIVTKQEAKVGEIVAAGAVVVSLISDARFEIEANIPEADIAKIKIGAVGRVELDAYGSEAPFEARVVAIDPAATIIEGVATYKTTLQFSASDSRIRSGMSADIEIIGSERTNVIAVPIRAVVSRNGNRMVRVLEGETIREVAVEVGVAGSDGYIEITAGLADGDRVVTSVIK